MDSTRRDLRPEALALFFAVATTFLLLSLATFDLADPPATYTYPANEQTKNLCGPLGARLARLTTDLLGVSSLILCVGGLTLALHIVRRRPVGDFVRFGFGFALLTVTGAALVQNIPAPEPLTSVYGAGGAIGLVLTRFLNAAVSPVGTYLLLVPAFFAGAFLAFTSPLLRCSSWLKNRVLLIQNNYQVWRASVAAARAEAAAVQKAPSPKPVFNLVGMEKEITKVESPVQEQTPLPREHPHQELKIVRTGFDEPKPVEILEAVDEEVEEIIERRLPVITPVANPASVKLPELDILDDPEPFEFSDHEQEILDRAQLLEKTLAQFQMAVKVVQIDTGPVVTQYEIELEAGLRARKVMAMADDLAIAMRAPNVRIVAPIPGKNTVGIEVPNERRAKVGLKEVMSKAASNSKMRLPLYLGKDVKGQPLVCDLATMPHLLIAGRTGTGKSVCLNTLILSILMTRTPDQVKMLMIDPKMVELSLYKSIPHLMHPVVTDMKKAEALLGWAVEKMEERYSLLARAGVRHIESYNKLAKTEIDARLGLVTDEDKAQIPPHLPYILIFADEMADLMMTSGKEVEQHIIRLAQKSRAVGIHLVLATQKPTVDVITGLIKSNLPARIAFQVASRMDSRVVLDEMGADKLLGNGDMLFLFPGTSKIVRAQGTFVSDEEVQRVVDFLSAQAKPQFSSELIGLQSSAAKKGEGEGNLGSRDDLYEAAIDVIVREGRGSVSLLQRALGIGYGRGARLIDYMAEDGIVGEYNGSQAREVLYTPEEWDEVKQGRFGRAG